MNTTYTCNHIPGPARSCPNLITNPSLEPCPSDEGWPSARTDANVAICMAKILSWVRPSNRSEADWSKEMLDTAWIAAWTAEQALPLASGLDLDRFIRRRIVGSAFAHYRSELTCAKRFSTHAPGDFATEAWESSVPLGLQAINPIHERVREALGSLPNDERFLLDQAFYEGRTQLQMAAIFGLNQSQFSRRIKAALKLLRVELLR